MNKQPLENMSASAFKRLTGVHQRTFKAMLTVLEQAQTTLKVRGGKPNHLSTATRLLMMLEYWREYRTYLHIGHSYGVSESSAYRNIKWCEDTLIKSGQFTLPGKKALLKSDMTYEIVVIDATETPIERPKKSNGVITQARKSGIV